jgi:hypothetical protein
MIGITVTISSIFNTNRRFIVTHSGFTHFMDTSGFKFKHDLYLDNIELKHR